MPYSKGTEKAGLYLNPKVDAYRWNVISLSREWKKNFSLPLKGLLFARIELTPPRKGIFDLDNRLKVPFDALKLAGFYDDDSQIEQTYILKKHSIPPGKIEICFIKMKYFEEGKCMICGNGNESHF
jgi:Holliday junction resolvase RusA-like endonuclease